MKIYIYDRKQILQVYYASKAFLKYSFWFHSFITSFITFQLVNGDMVFSRKTKVSCYKSEINKSVVLHAF